MLEPPTLMTWKSPIWHRDASTSTCPSNASNLPVLVENETTGPLVRRMFELVGHQGLNETQAWQEGIKLGLKQPRGGPLLRQTIHKMLRHPGYCGRIKNAATGG